MKHHLTLICCLFSLFATAQIKEIDAPQVSEEVKTSNSRDFFEGRIKQITHQKLVGFQNPDGSVRIPVVYDQLPREACSFMLAIKDGKHGIIDHQNNVLLPFGTYDRLEVKETWSFDRDDKIWLITAKNQNKIGVLAFKNGKMGLVNPHGKVMIPLKYTILTFLDKDTYGGLLDSQWEIINKQGQQLSPEKYDDIQTQYGGYLRVRRGANEGLILLPDTVLFKPEYDLIESVYPNFIAQKGDEMYSISRNDRNIRKSDSKPFNLYYVVKKVGQYEVIMHQKRFGYGVRDTTTGKFLFPPVFNYLHANSDGTYFVLSAKHVNAQILVNPKGEEIKRFTGMAVTPTPANPNLFQVEGSTDQFFITAKGEKLNTDVYSAIKSFRNGWFALKVGANWALAKPDGTRVTEYVYSSLDQINDPNYVVQGFKDKQLVKITADLKEH